ncbi:MAG: competence protein ComEA [Flavobacterium sp.]|jgi:competence protein ComEA
MNTKNIIFILLSCLILSFGNFTFADDSVPTSELMSAAEQTVNINTADADTLASVLSGIGVSRAYAIVEYRETNGKFYSAEELSAVRGIGVATIAKNENRILVE